MKVYNDDSNNQKGHSFNLYNKYNPKVNEQSKSFAQEILVSFDRDQIETILENKIKHVINRFSNNL